MIYEHDPQFPYRKIVVKDNLSVIGMIRRDLSTGTYHFYESSNDFRASFTEQRIDSIKMRIEEMMQSRAV